jgi:flagellar FliL protein
MADEDNKDKQNEKRQQETNKKPSGKKGVLKWIILVVVVISCAGAGLGLGRLFGRSDTGADDAVQPLQTELGQTPLAGDNTSKEDLKNIWYYDLEPVVANLNEPGATRYIRVVLTLQVSKALDPQKGTAFIQEKIPLLRNWLTIYLASQTIEDTRGDRNLMRIQSEILDAFNEKLFPDSKPLIKSIFFKDFAIQ